MPIPVLYHFSESHTLKVLIDKKNGVNINDCCFECAEDWRKHK